MYIKTKYSLKNQHLNIHNFFHFYYQLYAPIKRNTIFVKTVEFKIQNIKTVEYKKIECKHTSENSEIYTLTCVLSYPFITDMSHLFIHLYKT